MYRTRTAAAATLALCLALVPMNWATAAGPDRGGGDGGDRAGPGSPAPTTTARDTSAAISPTPRSVRARGDRLTIPRTVTVVAAPDADRPALDLVESSLKRAGANRVVRTAPGAGPGLTVYVDGAPASAALKSLGAGEVEELPAEGYALAIGAGRIALSGADATGTYYAAQSLRQLLPRRERPGAQVAGTVVRDWPATPSRGVIEGFYGTPWSHAARLDQLDFYGAHKMNIYVYSPKDDPYLRAKWRDPYPPEQLARIKELVDRARQRHVEFTYALSPGLSVCYSSDSDLKALTAKFQTLWDIGVRTFAVPLDDISYTKWNCAADKDRFGTGGGAAGAAQAHLLNRVNREFIATHQGAQPLQMVPTEYYDVLPSPYKQALATRLDANVLVEWTGVGVIAPTMTVRQANAARAVFGHQILVWDNYPVNDYVTDRLLLGPFNGREKGLPARLAGITANPMIQPAASKLALFTVADYSWNDAAYAPRASWGAALRELSGGDALTERALRAFGDVNYGSRLNPRQAPELDASFKEFWRDGDDDRLAATLETLTRAPGVLRDRMPDRGFVDDAEPWLDSTRAWGEATGTALRMVRAVRAGDGSTSWRLRRLLPELVSKAGSYVYVDMNGKRVPVVVGEGVLDAFVDDAIAEHDRALGVPGRPKASTDLGTYRTNSVARMADGENATFFWSDAAPKAGSHVTLDLRSERPLGEVTLAMGKDSSPQDYLHHGALEYSSDGKTWRRLASFDGKKDVSATAPAGTGARFLRARATQGQDNWLVVREFRVMDANGARVSGGPPAATGSDPRLAADGDPATAYRAERAAGPGESLDVTYSQARHVQSVLVLRPRDPDAGGANGASAEVQVREDGRWRTIGALSSGAYTELPAGGGPIDAVRLAWRDGSGSGAAPEVGKVILRCE